MKRISSRGLRIAVVVAAAGVAFAVRPAVAQITPRPQPEVRKMPDLVVTDVSFAVQRRLEAPNGVRCWEFTLNTTIRNRGSAPTGKGCLMSIHRRSNRTDSVSAGTHAVPALAAGDSVTLPPFPFSTCTFDANNNATPDPRKIFRVFADYQRDVTESDETNNSKEATFRVPMTQMPAGT